MNTTLARLLMAGTLVLASLALVPPASATAETDIAGIALPAGPCQQPGLVAVVECAVDNGEILVCYAVYGRPNCLPIILLDTASASFAIGPCQDPGILAVVKCAEDNGEILVCNAVYGTNNCLPVIFLDQATGAAALAFIGPCQQPGLVAVVNCAVDNGEVLVCNAVFGRDDCLPIIYIKTVLASLETSTTANADVLGTLNPCIQPGLVAVVQCAAENGEDLVCYAVWGYPDCITLMLQRLLATTALNLDSSGVIKDVFDAASCYQPGAVAVVECAGHNSEVLVCSAVYGRPDCTPLAF